MFHVQSKDISGIDQKIFTATSVIKYFVHPECLTTIRKLTSFDASFKVYIVKLTTKLL